MKRVFLLVLTGAIALGFVGCGEKKTICNNENVLNAVRNVYTRGNGFLEKDNGIPRNTINALKIEFSKTKIIKKDETVDAVRTICEAKATGILGEKRASSLVRYHVFEKDSGGVSLEVETRQVGFVPQM